MSRKAAWTTGTVLVMMIVCALLVKLVDSMVQIDDDQGLLMVFLGSVCGLIGLISLRMYRKGTRGR